MNKYIKLNDAVSFRTFGDTAVLLHHGSGDIHRLNAEAGNILERIQRGDLDYSADDLEFIEQLVQLGIVNDNQLCSLSPSYTPANTYGHEDTDLLDEINADAIKARVPLHCQLELTYRCPLRCLHCYLDGCTTKANEELSTQEIESLLDELASMGCLFLLLTGGEPFLRNDLEEIFNMARDRRFAVSLLTSGWNYDTDMLTKMARRGLDSVQISLHGADAEMHDAMTQVPGSFDAALECMRLLKKLGVRVRAAVTLTSANINSAPQIKSLLAKENIPIALGLYMSPRRDGRDDPQALTVGINEIQEVFRLFPPTAAPRLHNRLPEDQPCGTGSNTTCIDPHGTVFPCLPLRTAAGSIKKECFKDIWNTSKVLNDLRKIRMRDLYDCPTCEYIKTCNRCAGYAVSEGFSQFGHCSFDCTQAQALYLNSR